MAVNNTNPTTSVSENYSKYAEYFADSGSKTVLSIETFFTLLMAEMTNQDPLEPTSNTEFVSQLANFTALQNSSDALYYNTVSYAASLAGKTVTVAVTDGADGLKIDTGVVTGVDISDSSNIELTVNGKRYLLKNVMNVANASSFGGIYSSGSDGAYAVSLIGKKVTLLAETDAGTVLDEGVVDNIEVENGVFRVVVNGLSYTLDSIVRVYNNESTTGSSSSGTVTDPDEDGDKVTDAEEGTDNTETSDTEDNEDLKELFS